MASRRSPCVVLAAEGPVFSSGHDFNDMHGRNLDEMKQLLGICGELMRLLQRIPQPVIAQVEGLATAAGCQLVASCDLAVAGESARFQMPGGGLRELLRAQGSGFNCRSHPVYATASISTAAPSASSARPTVMRAGGSSPITSA